MKTLTLTDLVRSGDFLVLDTETTGLDSRAQICQIAIIDSDGAVLLDALVKPTHSIPRDAFRIHGITDERVKHAPSFVDIYEQLMGIIQGRNVAIYNADYDTRVLEQSAATTRHTFDILCANWFCIMQAYAPIAGDWNDYYKSYRWQRLTDACKQKSLPVEDAHTALGDALMTLALMKSVWGE